MNFSVISTKTLLGKTLRLPLRLIPPDMRMPILQGKLRGKKWIVGSSNHGCWLGSYEYEKRLLFEKTIIEGSIVFDIGAHVGFYTILASVLSGTCGRVFAFEPLPQNLLYLKKHLRLNHITNVSIIEAAVSDCNGVIFFKEGTSTSTGYISQQGQMKVKTVSLDSLISRGEIPVPSHIKIDVEGAEVLVLSGAKSILAKYNPIIFLATHGFDKRQQCRQLLNSLGYKLQAIGGKSAKQSNEIIAYKRNEVFRSIC